MKKSLLTIAILGAIGNQAFAQSTATNTVTIYGLVDVGVVNERGGRAGPATKLTSGVANGSRLGFRGTENLGGGLSANFVLESGIRADTGESDQNGTLFGRQAFVGLKGIFGAVTLGRQYTPLYIAVSTVADPFAIGTAGRANNLLPTAGSRTNNTIAYVTPALNGFTGEFAYSLGEVAGDNAASRQLGGALAYANGPLNVRLTYNNRNNDTSANQGLEKGRNTLLAANYNFGVAKAFLAYGIDKGLRSSSLPSASATPAVPNPYGGVTPSASTDSSDFLLGVSVPFGAHTVLASYIRKDDKTIKNQDADQWALGYNYSLSRRTTLYAAYARIGNKNRAGYTVGNSTEAGSGNKALDLGIRHTF